jgi:hypothetical protein
MGVSLMQLHVWGANCTTPIKNSKIIVRKIRGAKINPRSSFKNKGVQNMRGRELREQIRYNGFRTGRFIKACAE